MSFEDVIIKALGLQDVKIEKVVQFEDLLKLEVHVRQERQLCVCHTCGNSILQVHEWKERVIRGPIFGAFLYVYIHLKQLRGLCHICEDRIKSARVSFTHPNFQNMTMALCEQAGRLMEELPCEAVSRFYNLNSKTMWDLDRVRMEMMKPILKLPDDIDLSKMSADEVHFRTMQKETSLKKPSIKFVTNLVCYNSSKVLANASGRDSAALFNCLKVLSSEQLLTIKSFAVDMHDAYILVIKKFCPNAQICIDRFHLAERVNSAFDEVRKIEFKRAKESNDVFQLGMLMPHRRFVLVEREKKLSSKDIKMLDRLKELNKNILNGMILVEHFHKILDKTDVNEFRKSLTLWYHLVRDSGLKPFRNLSKTIRKYRDYIEAYVKSKLTTAVSEGINNKIKVLKRMGYGYSNEHSFMNKILQRCGYLNSRHIDTTSWFWRAPLGLA